MFLIRLVCGFCIGLLLMGCQTRVAWREEVQLSTGEVIVIDREVEHRGGGGQWPSGQGTVPQHYLISFEYPLNSGNIIRWRSTKFDMPEASWAELPLVLDLDQDRIWYLQTIQWINDNCIRYVTYQFQNNAWVEVPIFENKIKYHVSNLYLAAASNTVEDYISLNIKESEYSNGGYFKRYYIVGPKQVYPRGDGLECRWNPITGIYEAIKVKGENK